MSIRVKLTAAVAVLLMLGTVAVGFVALRNTRTTMLAQVDDRLVEANERVPDRRGLSPLLRGSPEEEFVPGDLSDDEAYREIAEIVLSRSGEVVVFRAAGFPDVPEALPDLPAPGTEAFERLANEPTTLPAVDGSIDYRVVARTGNQGLSLVLAASLADVTETTRDLLRTVLVAGGLVVVLGGLLAWWVIGRGLRPVDRMISTATAIAGGDLSQRVEHSEDDRSELGRLAKALDDMLGQLEAAFAERERSETRLRRFVADASHELRTPVSAIRGYAELYRSGGLEAGEQLDGAMRRVESESIRMGRLVEDLLLLARLDQHQPVELAPVDIAALAHDAVSDLRATDPERPVTIDAPEPVEVEGDEARLRQVLANLLANARFHTPDGTSVRVSVRRDGSDAVVSVADDGLGIPPEHRDRIFERFYRADTSRTRATGGSGLGLSIVTAVVEAHGGRVLVDSEPGRGATFTVRLPARGGQ